MSGETSTFFYSKRPFEPSHLPESLNIEVICDAESADKIVASDTAVDSRTGSATVATAPQAGSGTS
jgi:hypothetical protein